MNFVRLARVRFLAIALLLWASVVVARLAELQLAEGSRYRARAQRQQERRIEVSPLRGSIFDRAGRPLAVSVEVSSVYAIPDDVKDAEATARALARHLAVPEATLLARLRQKKGFVWIARKIDRAAATALKKAKLPGIHLVGETKRSYPKGSLAAAVLGYVGLDDKGLGGLEHSYDEVIRGKPGEIVALTDARRSTYGEAEVANGRPPQEGASLVVSIDSGIQFAAEQALSEVVAESQAKSGVVILLDPADGSVLAMATAPGFDPNDYGRYPADGRRNRAIADAHEPGSTFKIVTGAVALQNGVVTLDETIDTGDGTIRVGNVVISEHDRKRYGALTLAGVIEHSSNVGIIRVGLRLGPQRLWAGATALGVGRATGIDLPGENSGIFRRPERWSMLSNATISMGQEVSLTPLQLTRVAAAIANGGKLVRPRLVRRIAHPDLDSDHPRWLGAIGFCVLIVASSAIEALRFWKSSAALPLGPGGAIGESLASLFARGLGDNGATLLLVAAFLGGFSLFSGMSWLRLMERIGGALEGTVAYLRRKREEREASAQRISTSERPVLLG